jgi:hypothetical protein
METQTTKIYVCLAPKNVSLSTTAKAFFHLFRMFNKT